jgi:hypothetical protein
MHPARSEHPIRRSGDGDRHRHISRWRGATSRASSACTCLERCSGPVLAPIIPDGDGAVASPARKASRKPVLSHAKTSWKMARPADQALAGCGTAGRTDGRQGALLARGRRLSPEAYGHARHSASPPPPAIARPDKGRRSAASREYGPPAAGTESRSDARGTRPTAPEERRP